MPLFIQIDNGTVTGTLDSARPPLPIGSRRFVEMPDGAEAPPSLSVVTITGDKGEPIVPFSGAVRFDAPQPPVFKPSLDDRLDEILTEVKKGSEKPL